MAGRRHLSLPMEVTVGTLEVAVRAQTSREYSAFGINWLAEEAIFLFSIWYLCYFWRLFLFCETWSHCLAHTGWEHTCLSLLGSGHHHMRKSLNCETWVVVVISSERPANPRKEGI